MTSHKQAWTKGPWQATGKFIEQYEIHDDERLHGLFVADCRMTDEGAANAHLISAAPEMYEAGKRVLENAQSLTPEMTEALADLRAALTKAEGGADE